jgi:hypothetical protein
MTSPTDANAPAPNGHETAGVEELINAVRDIRDHVNEPRTHARLFAERPRFNRACSAMDMIGDTAQALRAYLNLSAADDDRDHGTSYLVVFGALQVLFVQQDAVFWLCKALERPRTLQVFKDAAEWFANDNPAMMRIRTLRNSSIGHPVNKDRGPKAERGSFFIVQMSLSPSGFRLMAANDAGETQFIPVPIPTLVQTQLRELTAVLKSALIEIRADDEAHRERYATEPPLTAIFKIHYPLEKMSEATRDASMRQAMGTYGTDAARGAMAAFRDRLAERGEPFGAAIEYVYKRLDVALTRLEHFFRHGPSEATPTELADVLVDYVFDRFAELSELAGEVDEKYVGLGDEPRGDAS